MSLENVGKLDLFVENRDDTNNTRVITNCGNSTLIQISLSDQINTVGLTIELFLGDALLFEIVPELDVSILANSNTHVVTVTDSKVVDATRVEVKNDLCSKGA